MAHCGCISWAYNQQLVHEPRAMHYQSKGGRKGILHCESWALHHNEGAGNAARVDTAQWLPCLDALAVVLDDILEHITSLFF